MPALALEFDGGPAFNRFRVEIVFEDGVADRSKNRSIRARLSSNPHVRADDRHEFERVNVIGPFREGVGSGKYGRPAESSAKVEYGPKFLPQFAAGFVECCLL